MQIHNIEEDLMFNFVKFLDSKSLYSQMIAKEEEWEAINAEHSQAPILYRCWEAGKRDMALEKPPRGYRPTLLLVPPNLILYWIEAWTKHFQDKFRILIFHNFQGKSQATDVNAHLIRDNGEQLARDFRSGGALDTNSPATAWWQPSPLEP